MPGGQEHERLLGDRHRPAAERVEVGGGQLAAAERSTAGGAGAR